MTTAYSGDGITFPDNTVQATAPRVGMVNRIINGDMRVSQRGTAAVTSTSAFPVDRFEVTNTANGTYSAQQSGFTPTGFNNSTIVTITAAQTAGTGNLSITQNVEGFNIADFGWGTASAQTITLSFWVRCSVTGTFGGSLRNVDSTRSYPYTYTISSADTWEYKTLSISGDTTGTWNTSNLRGVEVRFALFSSATQTSGSWYAGNATGATGQTQLASTSGATFYITGVQLEKGSTATDFEYVDYSRQLQQCQRYCQKSYNLETVPGGVTNSGILVVLANNSTYGECLQARFPVAMRASPTSTTYNPATGASGSIRNITGSTNVTASLNNTSQNGLSNLNVGLTSGSVYIFHYLASAEL